MRSKEELLYDMQLTDVLPFERMRGQELIDFAKECHTFWMENVDFSIPQQEVAIKLNIIASHIQMCKVAINDKNVSYCESIIKESLCWFKANKEKIIFKGE